MPGTATTQWDPSATRTWRDGAVLTDGGIDALATLVNRNVAALTGTHDDLVSRIVTEAIAAFVTTQGAPERAAAQVAPLLRELGERHACRGLDGAGLDTAFGQARMAALRGLQFAVRLPASSDRLLVLREDLARFVQLLRHQALTSWERSRALLDGRAGRELLAGSILRGDRPPSSRLLRRVGIEPDADHVLVVTSSAALPDDLLSCPRVLPATLREAVVPTAVIGDLAALVSPSQVVVGPTGNLRSLAQTADLVRRSAELLRDGMASDPRVVVPCTDLLAALVVAGNPGLTALIAAKHLAPLEALSPLRRLRTAELMLRWLETGLPINVLAREMGVPPQTAHSRMQRIRALYPVLDEPTQRLELIVALRSALPGWRAQVAHG